MKPLNRTSILFLLKVFFFICSLFPMSCSEKLNDSIKINELPNIFPDYKFVTIPINIAPLNFHLINDYDKIIVQFKFENEIIITCKGEKGINISLSKWQKMLKKASGKVIDVFVHAKKANKWCSFIPFHINVVSDPIDNYLAYRLIEPGYELWGQMGIYQRRLSTFEESAIVTNNLTKKSCVNCHSFSNYSSDNFMFHSRGNSGGTFVKTKNKKQKINTQTSKAISSGTYPIWHPSGNFIAFSSNTTRQTFHALPGKKIEVYDLNSDLIIYDIQRNTIMRDARFTSEDQWETFPAWSPDGKYLYFCKAKAKPNMPIECSNVRYGIYRVACDSKTGRLLNQIDTVVDPAKTGKSASFPRISPDGKYLLYTEADYGTFPLWHKEADLKMIDLVTNNPINIKEINSDEAESYHSWSSNGKWIVFSSRRLDGLYTYPYFVYFDSANKIHKPFLLPQKNSTFYAKSFKSYNIPEFVNAKVTISPYEISEILQDSAVLLDENIILQ